MSGSQRLGSNLSILNVLLIVMMLFVFGCATDNPKQREYTKLDKARMLVEMANGSLLDGDATGALQSIARAEETDSDVPELYHTKALAYYMKHDLDTAILAAQKAVSLKPDYSDANNTLGKLLMEKGRLKDAVKILGLAANDPLYRDAYKSWTNLGILEYRRAEYDKAEGLLTRAIQESPMQACIALYYRGHINLKNLHLIEAIRDYKDASKKLCAHFGDAYVALGLAYRQNRQNKEARKVFLEIQQRYPNTQFAQQALDYLKTLP